MWDAVAQRLSGKSSSLALNSMRSLRYSSFSLYTYVAAILEYSESSSKTLVSKKSKCQGVDTCKSNQPVIYIYITISTNVE